MSKTPTPWANSLGEPGVGVYEGGQPPEAPDGLAQDQEGDKPLEALEFSESGLPCPGFEPPKSSEEGKPQGLAKENSTSEEEAAGTAGHASFPSLSIAQPHSLPLDMNMGEGGDTAEAIGEYKVAMVINSQNSSELLSISSCPPSST